MRLVLFWVLFPLYAVLAAIDVLANKVSGFEDGRVRMRYAVNPIASENGEHSEASRRGRKPQVLQTVARESESYSL